MRSWWRQASDSAAVSFGFRHSGFFATLQVAGTLLRGLLWLARYVLVPLAVMAGAVTLAWWLWRHTSAAWVWPVGMVVVGAAVVALAALGYRRWRRSRYGFDTW
jgi:hypothetical protein